jgi:hypothetical protein
MSHRFNVPAPPSAPPITPIVYVREKTVWQYKVLSREPGQALSEEELNAAGRDGWELAAALPLGNALHFYFKRLKD